MEHPRYSQHKPDSERLATIEAVLSRLDQALLGQDGNGGFVAKTNDRLASLETDRSWIKGAYAALAAVVSALGLGGVLHIFSGKH